MPPPSGGHPGSPRPVTTSSALARVPWLSALRFCECLRQSSYTITATTTTPISTRDAVLRSDTTRVNDRCLLRRYQAATVMALGTLVVPPDSVMVTENGPTAVDFVADSLRVMTG